MRGRGVVPSRPITTFAELKADPRFLTPVAPNRPLLRTTYLPFEDFVKQNPSYKDLITVSPEQPASRLIFFELGGTLWAANVDATIAECVHDAVVRASKILQVTPEQLADVACVKNLNHPSNTRHSNKELHGKMIDALCEVRKEFNGEMFPSLEVTSHPRNPKLLREDLEAVLKERGLIAETVNEGVSVLSADNSGTRQLAHHSSTVRISLAVAAAVAAAAAPPEKNP